MSTTLPEFYILDRPYQMVSGAAEAGKFRYRKITGKRGTWLYPVNSDTPGEQIHFHDPTDTQSQGYGGSTLKFALEDGTEYAAKGPWHSNADASRCVPVCRGIRPTIDSTEFSISTPNPKLMHSTE